MFNTNQYPYVVVTCTGVVNDFPPAVSLVSNLLEIGCRVSLLACGDDSCLPISVRNNKQFEFICLGGRGGSLFKRVSMLYKVPHAIRSFLSSRRGEIDIVWTTMAIDVRDAGRQLYHFAHVMQIAELTERLPAFFHSNRPPYSKLAIKLARRASKVVVPEYNRAFIQQTLWRLPETPVVLPNKPSLSSDTPKSLDCELNSRFERENRKIILYQGLFADDRDLAPFADAVDSFNGEFVLYLMGKGSDQRQQDLVEEILSSHSNIEYVGFVPAPNHLVYTRYARIGLLPYKPSYSGECPPLNALYCAPNKIWEYSRFGIPMIGSDVPGLTGIFARFNCGITAKSNSKSIAMAIREVDSAHDLMSSGSFRLYDSVDTQQIVKGIISDVLRDTDKMIIAE